VPASIDLRLPKPVDNLVRNDRASASEGTKAQEGPFCSRPFRSFSQTAPSKFREDPAGGLPLPSRQFLSGLQNIIIDVKRGSHASDDSASNCPINNNLIYSQDTTDSHKQAQAKEMA
jgi:hypothetical protein